MGYKKLFIFFASATVVVLFFLAYRFPFFSQNISTDVRQLRQSTFQPADYRFIDPLLGCGFGGEQEFTEFSARKTQLSSYIESAKKNGLVDDVSVYFDTRDGRSLSIHSDQMYSPGSLMKVVTMIAVLKMAESQEDFLHLSIYFDGSFDENKTQFFKPQETLVAHTSYTVEELLGRMIAFSDNNALALLLTKVDRQILFRTYADLGIPIPSIEHGVVPDYMTIKTYAVLFRILHNATYLSRDMSEKAMEILATSRFSVGLQAGIPSGMPIAQKFGEYYAGENARIANLRELHDCGIIYAHKHGYLLCIFTKGKDYAKSASVMAALSSRVYTFVDSQL